MKSDPAPQYRPARSRTPLARQFELQLRATRTPIPWALFDRARYPKRALALATRYFARLAAGEYEAVEGFSRLTSILVCHGAPFDILAAAASVPAEEIRHADHAARLAGLCAGRALDDVELHVHPRMLEGAGQPLPTRLELDAMMGGSVAIGETISAAFISAAAATTKDPVVRAFSKQVLADEIGHARLGWYYLGWRATLWTPAERAWLSAALAEEVAALDDCYGHGPALPTDVADAARALGVPDGPEMKDVMEHVVEVQILPGLAALGLGATSTLAGSDARRRASRRAAARGRA